MNYMQIDKTSISNGLGFRVVLWCAGCTQKCKGCFNPETWDFNAGKPFDEKAKNYLFEQLSKPYIKGLTISGGHPLEQENLPIVRELCMEVRKKYPTKDIWLYTGYNVDLILPHLHQIMPHQTYTLEQLRPLCNIANVLTLCDVVVDGPYIEEQRDITLKFRGSRNQRIIDMQETLRQGKIVTLQDD